MPKRERETNEQQPASGAGGDHGSSSVTLLVMKGTVATSVRVDPSKYGFLSTQLQDEAYAQQYVNTDEVIADLSEGTVGPELAADIATTLDVADGKITVTSVRLAAQTLRGADYLQLREELYLEQAVTVLKAAAAEDAESPHVLSKAEEDSDVPSTSVKEVVPCVHTGQLMWNRLGAYTVLRLEQKGIISLGHKGIVVAKDKRISDELLALATVLNDVTSLDISENNTITTCEPFAETLVELNASWCGKLTDDGLKLCTIIRKLSLMGSERVTSCAPFADNLEELDAAFETCGVTNGGLKKCTKLRKLDARWNEEITTCKPFLDTLEHLHTSAGFTVASLNQVAAKCPHLRHLDLNDSSMIMKDKVIQKVASRCRQLEYLMITGRAGVADAVTDAAIIGIAENCTQLKELFVNLIALMTDASIIKVAENCRQLTKLSLCGPAHKITDAALTAVAKNCNKLKSLIVGGQGNITDASILEIAKCCPHLIELAFSTHHRCKITNESLKHLPPSCCVRFATPMLLPYSDNPK